MFQGGGGVGRLIFYFERVQRIVIVLGVRTNQRRDGRSPGGAHFLPAIEIAYRVLQDALKQRRQFRARTPRIFLGQFHHGILDDIQSDVLVPYAKKRLLVCPTFHLGEEVRQFLVCSQFGRLFKSFVFPQCGASPLVALPPRGTRHCEQTIFTHLSKSFAPRKRARRVRRQVRLSCCLQTAFT